MAAQGSAGAAGSRLTLGALDALLDEMMPRPIQPGEFTVRMLAEDRGVAVPTAARVVARLLADGCITERACIVGGRRTRVFRAV